MTTLEADIRDSLGSPIEGYILITLAGVIVEDQEVRLTVPASVPLVGGLATFELAPTDDDRVSYRFDVYKTGTPDTLVYSFSARVPSSNDPVSLSSISQQTGIELNSSNANLAAIVRSLYLNPDFWALSRDMLIPHKGTYDPLAFYKNGDIVYSQGSSYIYADAIARAGVEPVNGDTWKLIAAKGDPGNATTGSDTDPYSEVSWAGNIEAPSKASVRDAVEQLARKDELGTYLNVTDGVATGLRTAGDPPVSDRSTRLVSSQWTQDLADDIRAALVPVGMPAPWLTASPPLRWVLLNGNLLDRAVYAELFAVYGTAFNLGGEAGTQFRLPDLRGRSFAGADAMISAAAGVSPRLTGIGVTAGSEQVTLTIPQLPVFTPLIRRGTGSGPLSAISATAANNAFSNTTSDSAYTVPVGGGQSHENLPPVFGCYWIAYAGVTA